MDRDAMLTQVRDIIGEDAADFWKDAELVRYLQEANYRFHNEERWPWLVVNGSGVLVAGDPDLVLTDGIAATRHINFRLTVQGNVQRYMAKRVSAAKGFQLESLYSVDTTQTYPEWFYITSVTDPDSDGEHVYVARFVPVNTSEVDVEFQYTRDPGALSAGTDVPDCPVEYHKALVHYAAGTAWLKELNGGPKAREQFEMYGAVLEQARADWQNEPDDSFVVAGKDEPQYSMGREVSDPWLLRIPEVLGP